jgi:hypothetical protein
MFAITSRYYGISTAEFEAADGKKIVYLRRRFVPQPSALTSLLDHKVVEGDRLDNISARYLGDPEQFWRICDGNGAIRPEELIETVGRSLRITLPEGVPGVSNA